MISKAPAKVILFGEHAVVYGQPAISMAINLHSTVEMDYSKETTIDGLKPDFKYHSYILKALEIVGIEKNLRIRTESMIESSSGLGSSASISVATVSSALALKNSWKRNEIAKMAFLTEHNVQGRASPVDTSTITAGGCIIVSSDLMDNALWKINLNERTWYVSRIEINELNLIVVFSGVKGSTAVQVEKVYNFVSKNSFGMEIIKKIGNISIQSIKELETGDVEKIGELMNENNKLLSILGVGHEKTNEIIESVMHYSYGAKITGAGGGGSVIILPKDEDRVMEILESKGYRPFKAKMDRSGVSLVQ